MTVNLLERILLLALVCGWLAPPTNANAYEWSGKLTEATRALSSQDSKTRAKAVRGLVYFPLDEVRPHLLKALEDPSVLVKLVAIEAMIETRNQSDNDKLHPFLTHPDPMLRIGALKALGELGDKDDLDAMVRTLGDGSEKVRAAAIRALTHIGPEAKVPIAAMLSDAHPSVVVVALDALAKIGDQTAVFPMLEKVKEPQVRVQLAAIRGLGELGDSRAVLPLVGLLYSPHEEVQICVIDALGRLRDSRATHHLVKLLWSEHRSQIGGRVIHSLGDIADPKATDALIQMMRYSQTAQAATNALKKVGPPVIPYVIDALRQSNSSTFQKRCLSIILHTQQDPTISDALQEGIAAALTPELGAGRLPPDELLATLLSGRTPSTLGPLVTYMGQLIKAKNDASGRNSALRRQLLSGLARWNDPRLTQPLMKLYPLLDRGEQKLALKALGGTRDPAVVELLETALESDEAGFRAVALEGLARIDTLKAGLSLMGQLRPENKPFFFVIAEGLGTNSSDQVRDALVRTLDTSNTDVRLTVIQALGEHHRRKPTVETSNALLDIVSTASEPQTVSRALDALGSNAVPGGFAALEKRYKTSGMTLKLKIIQTFGDWRMVEASGLIKEALSSPKSQLRAEAAWALGQLGATGSTPAIRPLLDDPHWPVGLNAAAALAILGDESGKKSLTTALGSGSSYTRINALYALEKISAAPTRVELLQLAHREADPRIIEAAARILAARGSDADEAALEKLVKRTSDPQSSKVIRALMDKGQTSDDGPGWIRYVFTDSGRRMVGQRVIIILPNGLLLGRSSDLLGEVRVENISEGRPRIVFLDDAFTRERED